MLTWSQHGCNVNFRAILLAHGCFSTCRELLIDSLQVTLDIVVGFANVLSIAEAPGLCCVRKSDQANLSSEVLRGWTNRFRFKLKTARATSNISFYRTDSALSEITRMLSV